MRLGNQCSRVSQGGRFADSVELLREAPGTRGGDGRFIPGVITPVPLTGNFQPLSFAERSSLPENDRIKEAYLFTTQTTDRDLLRPLRVGPNQTRGDIIVRGGLQYRVKMVDDFSSPGNLQAIVVRREGQDD